MSEWYIFGVFGLKSRVRSRLGPFFPPVSGFWALTVNMRLFEKRGVLNRRGGAFWWSDAARSDDAQTQLMLIHYLY